MNLNYQKDIDRVLNALGHTDPPTGLEARTAHRLLQAQTTPAPPRPFHVALILGFTKDLRIQLAAATALAIAVTIPLAHHKLASWQTGSWQTENQPRTTSTTPTPNAVILSGVARGLMREAQPKDLPAARITNASQTVSTPTPEDPEAIALAETLAPSQPIPTQPLTAEERLLLRATRQGQPIEVAELELAREPILRAAAEAREHSASAGFSFAHIAHSLLAPLAEAESLQPTPPSTDAQPESPR
jgi:hypothetical protein